MKFAGIFLLKMEAKLLAFFHQQFLYHIPGSKMGNSVQGKTMLQIDLIGIDY